MFILPKALNNFQLYKKLKNLMLYHHHDSMQYKYKELCNIMIMKGKRQIDIFYLITGHC